MNGAMLLQHAAGVIEHRESIYGPPQELFAQIARRWSLVLGMDVTPVQVALCLIDLKLARLTRNPSHLDSVVDVAGYAAILSEVAHAWPRAGIPRATPAPATADGGRTVLYASGGVAPAGGRGDPAG